MTRVKGRRLNWRQAFILDYLADNPDPIDADSLMWRCKNVQMTGEGNLITPPTGLIPVFRSLLKEMESNGLVMLHHIDPIKTYRITQKGRVLWQKIVVQMQAGKLKRQFSYPNQVTDLGQAYFKTKYEEGVC